MEILGIIVVSLVILTVIVTQRNHDSLVKADARICNARWNIRRMEELSARSPLTPHAAYMIYGDRR